MSLSPWKWKPRSEIGCKKKSVGGFRDQKVDLGTWILFYQQASTHSFDIKKTRNSNSKNKILCGRPTFLVHVRNWEKIIARTVNQLWSKISQRSEGVMSSDFDRICVPEHTFDFFENLMWISHILVFFSFRFSITSFSELRRSWASCLDVHGDLCFHFGLFSKIWCGILIFWYFFDCSSRFWF